MSITALSKLPGTFMAFRRNGFSRLWAWRNAWVFCWLVDYSVEVMDQLEKTESDSEHLQYRFPERFKQPYWTFHRRIQLIDMVLATRKDENPWLKLVFVE